MNSLNPTTHPTRRACRREQIRQAKRIHGGTLAMWAASVGVKLARAPIPSRRLRERLFRTLYGRKYAPLAEEELDRPLGEFRSLNELFTRGVRPELRPLPDDAHVYVSPCDGVVQETGRLDDRRLLSVKGIDYRLEELAPTVQAEDYANGHFAILFLSPVDCHRVYAPGDALLQEVVHVPGSRLLVHPPYQRREFPVFSLNERVVMRCAGPLGEFLIVMVAGWGVGHITHPFPVDLHPCKKQLTALRLTHPRRVRRGEWIATFELGSTVVFLAPAQPQLRCVLEKEQIVRARAAAFQLAQEVPQPEANSP